MGWAMAPRAGWAKGRVRPRGRQKRMASRRPRARRTAGRPLRSRGRPLRSRGRRATGPRSLSRGWRPGRTSVWRPSSRRGAARTRWPADRPARRCGSRSGHEAAPRFGGKEGPGRRIASVMPTPFSRGFEQHRGVGDRTSAAFHPWNGAVTVAGLCRNCTGFATRRRAIWIVGPERSTGVGGLPPVRRSGVRGQYSGPGIERPVRSGRASPRFSLMRAPGTLSADRSAARRSTAPLSTVRG